MTVPISVDKSTKISVALFISPPTSRETAAQVGSSGLVVGIEAQSNLAGAFPPFECKRCLCDYVCSHGFSHCRHQHVAQCQDNTRRHRFVAVNLPHVRDKCSAASQQHISPIARATYHTLLTGQFLLITAES